MSDAKLFRLMLEHPNPVTRAVYRDIWFNRQQARSETLPKDSQ